MPRLSAGSLHRVSFTLNGRTVSGQAEPRLLLTDFIRHVLGATGTHVGCEHGVCGACTVQIDGAPARSCLALAVQVEGADIRTVEGLAPAADRLSPAGRLFASSSIAVRLHAGYLMPLGRLRERPEAREPKIRAFLSGHLCRCTGYGSIVRAALEAARKGREVRGHA
jgi:2-furoyl-CoA dehydrogenase 2Fe-2S iron sulfur subunit